MWVFFIIVFYIWCEFWLRSVHEWWEHYVPVVEQNLAIVFEKISKKNNLHLQNDLYKCYHSKNVKDLDKAKENLLKKVDKLDAKEKKETVEILDKIKNLNKQKEEKENAL